MTTHRSIAAAMSGALVCAALVTGLLTVDTAFAQAQQKPQPTAAALATAREIVDIKGAITLFKPVVSGVIETVKLRILQTNPNLQRDLDAVAKDLKAQTEPRFNEIHDQLAKIYAQHFNEQELKDILVFYKSPLGKKLIEEEPKFTDQSMTFVQEWADKLAAEMVDKFRAEMKKKGHDL
ncbi:MAG: DUF2059 domain-containing protein [Rhizobiales bacterium]|mgnify:CR=1 FL=1|nr:DUF2059 domain-containing protein [Hyphomicrobiales bacterium]